MIIAIVALAAIGFAAGGNRDEEPAEDSPAIQPATARAATPATAPAPTAAPAPVPTAVSDEEIELMAIRITWDAELVCPIWNDLEAMTSSAAEREMFMNVALDQFEAGYGEPLSPAGRALVRDLMNDC